MMQIVAC